MKLFVVIVLIYHMVIHIIFKTRQWNPSYYVGVTFEIRLTEKYSKECALCAHSLRYMNFYGYTIIVAESCQQEIEEMFDAYNLYLSVLSSWMMPL